MKLIFITYDIDNLEKTANQISFKKIYDSKLVTEFFF